MEVIYKLELLKKKDLFNMVYYNTRTSVQRYITTINI